MEHQRTKSILIQSKTNLGKNPEQTLLTTSITVSQKKLGRLIAPGKNDTAWTKAGQGCPTMPEVPIFHPPIPDTPTNRIITAAPFLLWAKASKDTVVQALPKIIIPRVNRDHHQASLCSPPTSANIRKRFSKTWTFQCRRQAWMFHRPICPTFQIRHREPKILTVQPLQITIITAEATNPPKNPNGWLHPRLTEAQIPTAMHHPETPVTTANEIPGNAMDAEPLEIHPAVIANGGDPEVVQGNAVIIVITETEEIEIAVTEIVTESARAAVEDRNATNEGGHEAGHHETVDRRVAALGTKRANARKGTRMTERRLKRRSKMSLKIMSNKLGSQFWTAKKNPLKILHFIHIHMRAFFEGKSYRISKTDFFREAIIEQVHLARFESSRYVGVGETKSVFSKLNETSCTEVQTSLVRNSSTRLMIFSRSLG